MFYIHYSFDLWFTLIKSNGEFKKKRSSYFYNSFNSLNKSIAEIEIIFRQVDLMCNAINEKTGHNISSEEMYLMVIYQINESNEVFQDIDLVELYLYLENMLMQFAPTLFSSDTITVLQKIKEKENITTNILSNTAFVKGNTLRKVVQNLGIEKYIDFQIYSDEVNLSKPNIEIYNLLVQNVFDFRKDNQNIALSEIIHIGDNVIADIKGAESKGLQSYQINTNDKLIIDILT